MELENTNTEEFVQDLNSESIIDNTCMIENISVIDNTTSIVDVNIGNINDIHVNQNMFEIRRDIFEKMQLITKDILNVDSQEHSKEYSKDCSNDCSTECDGVLNVGHPLKAFEEYLGKKIGGGVYSGVYEFKMDPNNAVVKVSMSENTMITDNSSSSSSDETLYNRYLLEREKRILQIITDEILLKNLSPHFPFLYKVVDWGEEVGIWWIMEASDIDGEHIMDKKRKAVKRREIPAIDLEIQAIRMTVQVIMGLHVLHSKLDVVHNDFSPRNVVQERTTSEVLEYHCKSSNSAKVIRIKTHGRLFKIVDFGMCSGLHAKYYGGIEECIAKKLPNGSERNNPWTWTKDLLPFKHEYVVDYYNNRDKIRKNCWYEIKNANDHITSFPAVPPYARDLVYFLVHLTTWDSKWAKFAAQKIDCLVRKGKMFVNADWDMHIFDHLFSPKVLQAFKIKYEDIFETNPDVITQEVYYM